MPEGPAHVITAEAVQKAGKLIAGAVENASSDARRSPAFDKLAAAKHETAAATRAAKKAEALREGASEARAEARRLEQARQALSAVGGAPEFTPEAQRELEGLKETIRQKIRRKAEEEIARTYPEVEADKKRRAPRRNRMDV